MYVEEAMQKHQQEGFDPSSLFSRHPGTIDPPSSNTSPRSFEIPPPPSSPIPLPAQKLALLSLDDPAANDFEILCDDGRSIDCSRQALLDHWEWFRSLRVGKRSDYPPHPASLPNHRRGKLLDRDTLQLPEPYPVALALVQYFCTLALGTPLQNRPLVVTALLEVAKVYDLRHLEALCVHNLHSRLDASTAEGIAETARELGHSELAARAEEILMSRQNKPRHLDNGLPSPDRLRHDTSRPNFAQRQRSQSHAPTPNRSSKAPIVKTTWSPPDRPAPPLLLVIPQTLAATSSRGSSPAPSSRSRSNSSSSRPGKDAPPSPRTPHRQTAVPEDVLPSQHASPPSPVIPRNKPPRSPNADLSGGLFDFTPVIVEPTAQHQAQVAEVVIPTHSVRPSPKKRSGSLPPLSWSASSCTTSTDDESLRSPTSLAHILPWTIQEFPPPPTSLPRPAPMPPTGQPSAPHSTARNAVRKPLLRRPLSIDTILSVMSVPEEDEHTYDVERDGQHGDTDPSHHLASPYSLPSLKTGKQTVSPPSISSDSSTTDSRNATRSRTSFVSLGAPSSSSHTDPTSKEAKKLDKKYRELLKAQSKFQSARLRAEDSVQKAVLAQEKKALEEEKKREKKEAEEKRRKEEKMLRRMVEESRKRRLAMLAMGVSVGGLDGEVKVVGGVAHVGRTLFG